MDEMGGEGRRREVDGGQVVVGRREVRGRAEQQNWSRGEVVRGAKGRHTHVRTCKAHHNARLYVRMYVCPYSRCAWCE